MSKTHRFRIKKFLEISSTKTSHSLCFAVVHYCFCYFGLAQLNKLSFDSALRNCIEISSTILCRLLHYVAANFQYRYFGLAPFSRLCPTKISKKKLFFQRALTRLVLVDSCSVLDFYESYIFSNDREKI